MLLLPGRARLHRAYPFPASALPLRIDCRRQARPVLHRPFVIVRPADIEPIARMADHMHWHFPREQIHYKLVKAEHSARRYKIKNAQVEAIYTHADEIGYARLFLKTAQLLICRYQKML